MSTLLPYLVRFPIWWYAHQSRWWLTFATRTLLLAIDKVAILPQLKSLFSPYHDDRTFVGRALGVCFRLTWISGGIFILLLIGIAIVGGYLLWLVWPLSFIWGLAAGGWNVFIGLLLSIAAIAYYWIGYVLQPKHPLNQLNQLDEHGQPQLMPDSLELREYAAGTARKLLRDLPPSFSTATLMRSLTEDPMVLRLFKRMDLTDQQLISRMNQLSAKQSQVMTQDQLIAATIEESQRLRHRHLLSTDLFLGFVKASPLVQQIMTDLGIQLSELEQGASWVEAESNAKSSWKWWTDEHFRRLGGVDRGWTSGWTPTMRHFSVDVTAQVSMGIVPYIVGREREISQVMRILERTTKNNVLLLGEPGVGKSSIVAGIAQAILQANTTPELAESKVIELDLQGLLASVGSGDAFVSHLTTALNELTKAQSILFINGIDQLVGQRGAGTIDASATLLPFIESGSIRVIGATDPTSFHRVMEQNTSFIQHFQSVTVEEPDLETCVTILQEFAAGIEGKQRVTISLPAIKATVDMASKYIHDRVMPEKAIDLLDEVAVYVAHQRRNVVGAEDVAAVVAEKTGIPVTNVTADESTKLQQLESHLHQRIIGQEHAVEAVANALRRSRAGLRDEKKPMAVFLFIGPTGVGKTELAKTIAESYFGSEESMIRLDMSEYQDAGSVNKLIGPPPGHADFEIGGQLTTAIRDNPFTVVLLDELEKANPQILDLFLQVFDDGRLTDGAGRTVTFSQTVIIATSNAGARSIQTAIKQGYTTDQIGPAVKEMLAQRYFRPEFLNRFDDIIVFRPLSLDETMQIARLMLAKVANEVRDQQIELSADDEVIKRLAEAGYDPLYGARPMRHLIQDKVENMLAKKILSGELKRGSMIHLTVQDLAL